MPVACKELPAARDAEHRSAVAKPPAAVTVRPQEHAGRLMPCAQAIEAGVAHRNAHRRGLKVGAAGHADVVGRVNQTAVNAEQPFFAGKAIARAEQSG